MNSSLTYKGYVIDIYKSTEDYRFTVKKGEKIITTSPIGFPLPPDAEIQAKMFINKLIGSKEGWMIS